MLSVYGSSGFIGTKFIKLYNKHTFTIKRDTRKPKSSNILYFLSTTHNHNIHTNITLDVKTNLNILCEVLEHCKKKNMIFNFISSSFVYGNNHSLAVDEETICNPNGFYAITKKCAEDLLIDFCSTFNTKYRILRLCNIIGPNDKNASQKKKCNKLVNRTNNKRK